MISYVTRDRVNLEKYNNCISNAINTRIYAYSWYLDIVADKNWDVLVLDDYVAVMPLPKRKKYFVHYIFLPSWSQQLGVFSKNEIDSGLVEDFLKAIPKKFKLVEVFFNSSNCLKEKKFSKRTNYILPLNGPYETLYKNYKKGRKSSIKQAVNSNLKIVEGFNYKKIIALFKFHKDEATARSIDYQLLYKLWEQASSLKLVLSIGVTNEKNELIGGALFLKNKDRITYLFSSINLEGREKQAMSLLLDYVIQKFSRTSTVLDFEGSMMAKIALFFRSFGAGEEHYYHFKKYALW